MEGLVLIKISNRSGLYNIIFQKGKGGAITQKLIDLYKKRILRKVNGNIIALVDEFLTYIHFFKNIHNKVLIIIYLGKKENTINCSTLYFLYKKIFDLINNNIPINNIMNICNNLIKINGQPLY